MTISNDANNDDSSSNATRNAWNNDGSNAAVGTTCSACLLLLRILVLRMTISTDAGNDYNDVGNYADWNDPGNAVSSSNDDGNAFSEP